MTSNWLKLIMYVLKVGFRDSKHSFEFVFFKKIVQNVVNDYDAFLQHLNAEFVLILSNQKNAECKYANMLECLNYF